MTLNKQKTQLKISAKANLQIWLTAKAKRKKGTFTLSATLPVDPAVSW
jgi:hypothetical protein